LVESHDQRWQEYQVGEHGDDQGCGSENSQGNSSAEIRESENDESEKQYHRSIDDAFARFQDAFTYRSGNKKSLSEQFLAVFGEIPDRVVHRNSKRNAEDQGRTGLQRDMKITHQAGGD